MALGETQQILEAIKRSTRPLICVPRSAGADGYASAIGLARVLEKLDKKADIVAADGTAPKNLHFLPGHEKVSTVLENLRRFVIEIDASRTKVDELTYEMKDDKLVIHLSPKKGFWDAKDLNVSSSGYRYDLIVCLGAADLESCAHLYSDHPDFFYRTPILNIDHRAENEHFGQLNVVDLTAVSVSEVVHDLVEAIEPGLLDEEVVTALLTGMISKTKSFKTKNVSPKTLQTASKLVAKGARREAIVHNLYRTRSVPTLRLWGRALARLKVDAAASFVWTLLSQQDFLHAGAEEADLPDVIEELIASTPDAKVVALIYETAAHEIVAIIRAERPTDVLALTAALRPTGTREEVRVAFPDKTIVQAEKEIVACLTKKPA
ncbi:MAG: hypothetical protein WCO25_05115 [Candidatus Uhrbacteria bacterium]